MKKYLSTIKTLSKILILGLIVVPHFAHADVASSIISLIGGVTTGSINSVLAMISYWVLTVTSTFVAITGILLSVSMNITTHLSQIVEQVSAIKAVWIVVRDISSIFIIFALLYYSIRTILGVGGGNFNKLVVNIFIAGILINFSLFFIRIAIDASNLVSLQFYNAIAPETSQNLSVAQSFSDGGLSNVFMQSLKIPTIYKNIGILKTADVSASISIATVGGIIIMITAGLSFLAASMAFIARTAILIFVLAFSPFIFVGMIFPQIKSKTGAVLDMLYNQCVFMPVYLFLMYVALRILGDPNFTAIFNAQTTGGLTASTNVWGPMWIGTFIQYAVALIFINAPLVTAISFGGVGMKWAPGSSGINAVNSWVGGKIAGAGKGIAGAVGRNTIGKGAKTLGEKFDTMEAGLNKPVANALRALNITQTARGFIADAEKSRFGSTQSLKDIKEENKKRDRELATVRRENERDAAINRILESKSTTPPTITGDWDKFKKALGKMNKKEVQELKLKQLKNEKLLAHLSSEQFKNIIDDSNESLTYEEKDELKEARKNYLIKELSSGGVDAIDITKKLDGKELSKLSDTALTQFDVMNNLTPEKLKEMTSINGNIKRAIKNHIMNIAPGSHPAKGWMNKNATEWS